MLNTDNNFMKLTFQWFYGRDLRSLTDSELKTAIETLGDKPKKSRLSQIAWQGIIKERNRRGYDTLKNG